MAKSYVEGIKTQFVRDRLKETSWANREYIAVLKILEEIYEEGGARGFGKMWHGHMRQRYPVEDECIRKEIQEGVYTPPEEFRRLVAEWKEEQRRKEAEWRRRQLEEQRREQEWLEEERRKWLEAGGKP